MRTIWLVPLLCLAACDPAPAPEAARNDVSETTLNYQAEVAKLSAGQRNGVMIRAIRDAGIACQGVTATEPLPDQGSGFWRATCQGGASHIIQINPDGTANVVSATGATSSGGTAQPTS